MSTTAPDPYLLASTIINPEEHLKIALDATASPTATSSDGDAAAPPSLSPQNPRRIFVIVSNVASSVEQAAILFLKPRNKDPNTAALLAVIPILPSIDIQLHQHDTSRLPSATSSSLLPSASGSLPSIQSILDAVSLPIFLTGQAANNANNSSDAQLGLTIACCAQSASAATSDTQGLKDFLSVLRDLTKVAEQHSFSLATSHQWLSAYTDDLPFPGDAAAKPPAVPIFEHFSKSAILPRHHDRTTRPPSPAQDEIRLSVGTFNVAGQWPQHDANTIDGLKSWLRTEEEPDLIVLGFQEVDTSGGAYLYYSPAREDAWTRAAVQAMGLRAGEYTKIASKQLVGLLILVFARSSIKDSITELATASVGVGLGGFVANKGAVAVRLQLGRRTICFVNAHLSAFEGLQAMERRCWDWSEIYKRLRFKIELPATASDDEAEEEGEKSRPAEGGGDSKTAEQEREAAVEDRESTPTIEDSQAAALDEEEAGATVEATAETMDGTTRTTMAAAAGADGPGAQDAPAGVVASLGTTYIDAERDDVAKALSPVEKATYDPYGDADADVSAAWKPWDKHVVEYNIRDHDIIINMGDLNFRLDLDHGSAHQLIQSRSYGSLYQYDQLESLRNSGSLFDDFEEGRITFAPTYKFDRGTDQYDTSDKKRVPAWTDRVLWCVTKEWDDEGEVAMKGCGDGCGTDVGRGGEGGKDDGKTEGQSEEAKKRQRQGLVLQRYESVPAVRFSDHRAVRATFLVRIQ